MAVKLLASVILGAALTLTGCSTTETASQAANGLKGDPLMSVLTNSTGEGLGLTQTQAAGGLGSVMSLASSKLPAADYAELGKALPNADKYIEVAKSAGVAHRSDHRCRRVSTLRCASWISVLTRHPKCSDRCASYVAKVGGEPSREHAHQSLEVSGRQIG